MQTNKQSSSENGMNKKSVNVFFFCAHQNWRFDVWFHQTTNTIYSHWLQLRLLLGRIHWLWKQPIEKFNEKAKEKRNTKHKT